MHGRPREIREQAGGWQQQEQTVGGGDNRGHPMICRGRKEGAVLTNSVAAEASSERACMCTCKSKTHQPEYEVIAATLRALQLKAHSNTPADVRRRPA